MPEVATAEEFNTGSVVIRNSLLGLLSFQNPRRAMTDMGAVYVKLNVP